MTKEELAEIKARCEAATSGPWHKETETDGDQYESWSYVVGVRAEVPEQWQWVFKFDDDYGNDQNADAEFIAHARIDVPRLIAAIDRLRDMVVDAQTEAEMQTAEVERLRAVLAQPCPSCGEAGA